MQYLAYDLVWQRHCVSGSDDVAETEIKNPKL